MIDVYLASGGIGIGCPGTTPVRAPVRIVGDYNLRFVNAGDEDGVVYLKPTMSDSAGYHSEFDQEALVVPAGGERTTSGAPFLERTYGTAGPVAVRIRVVISGAVNDSKDALCTFNVA